MKFVKQLTIILISFVIVALLCVNTFADNETQDKEYIMDTNIISIINGQLSDTEISALKASGIPELAADEQFRSESPVLKIFNELFSPKIGEPLETRLAEAEAMNNKASYTNYILLNNTPCMIRMMHNDTNKKVSIDRECYASTIPTYISDIMELSKIFVTEKNCVLEGIYCFDADTSYQGTAVYLKTDKGVYVRYYENSTSEAILFTEEDFRHFGIAYYDYITSYEYNYNENGEALGGGNISFVSFIQDLEKNNGTASNDGIFGRNTKIILLSGAIALATIFTVITVIFICKKNTGNCSLR